MKRPLLALLVGSLFLSLGTIAKAAHEMDFDDIDADSDGFISHEEAKEGDLLVARTMYKYDADKDGQLSTSEFSALEEEEPSALDLYREEYHDGGPYK